MDATVDSHTYNCIRRLAGIYDEKRRYPYYWMDYNPTGYYRYNGHHYPSTKGNRDYPNWKMVSKKRKQWMRKRFYLHQFISLSGNKYLYIRK
ncbi:hypothetical protein SAMN05518672_10912 [Chitinophaga sp. CF118]|uniref:hypothetical protein n=1 Tax=Chitinophaga sp. CF118 TaxID=1884367 RepID=UPI0008E1C082|nr:hypothetical protein [Chitinophaga sp. CF118]SFE66790.1 hypothetical protein SAMN05518672_10912 [Chitinophaga sp. CF118]